MKHHVDCVLNDHDHSGNCRNAAGDVLPTEIDPILPEGQQVYDKLEYNETHVGAVDLPVDVLQGHVISSARVDNPTIEVLLEHPNGTRVSVSTTIPLESLGTYDENDALQDAGEHALQLYFHAQANPDEQ